MQSLNDHSLYRTWRCWTIHSGLFPDIKRHAIYGSLFIYIGWMPLMSPTLDYAHPLFALGITSDQYLQHVQVTDQDPASGSL